MLAALPFNSFIINIPLEKIINNTFFSSFIQWQPFKTWREKQKYLLQMQYIFHYKLKIGLLRNLDVFWFSFSLGFNALIVFSQKSFNITDLSLKH